MSINQTSREIEETTRILHDLMETIRVNMEILEILKLKGRIKLTDKQFIEITELDKKHRNEFQKFVLKKLPEFLDGDLQSTQKVLKKTFLVWAADLQISLVYLDREIKKYMKEIHEKDLKNLRGLKEPEVKDKRFWKFLDKVRSKSRLYESFDEAEEAEVIEPDGSDQPGEQSDELLEDPKTHQDQKE